MVLEEETKEARGRSMAYYEDMPPVYWQAMDWNCAALAACHKLTVTRNLLHILAEGGPKLMGREMLQVLTKDMEALVNNIALKALGQNYNDNSLLHLLCAMVVREENREYLVQEAGAFSATMKAMIRETIQGEALRNEYKNLGNEVVLVQAAAATSSKPVILETRSTAVDLTVHKESRAAKKRIAKGELKKKKLSLSGRKQKKPARKFETEYRSRKRAADQLREFQKKEKITAEMKADRAARVQNLSGILNKLKAMKTEKKEEENVVKMEEGPIGLAYLPPAI